jgi:hypothetical protein
VGEPRLLPSPNLEVLANDYRGDPALESGGSHVGALAWARRAVGSGLRPVREGRS